MSLDREIRVAKRTIIDHCLVHTSSKHHDIERTFYNSLSITVRTYTENFMGFACAWIIFDLEKGSSDPGCPNTFWFHCKIVYSVLVTKKRII